MNYFAHGVPHLQAPYFLAGTAVPDWLSVVNRRVRVRSRAAEPFLTHADERWRALAQGIQRHHHDDGWFHNSVAFQALMLEFTRDLRARLSEEDSHRPAFLGHILVEILLDAELISRNERELDRYYEVLGEIDPAEVAAAVGCMARQAIPELGEFIRRFWEVRFLYDYLDDAKLLGRLNQVMSRVRLPSLPDSLVDYLPVARERVRLRTGELLAEP